jgi:hypothetical protein
MGEDLLRDLKYDVEIWVNGTRSAPGRQGAAERDHITAEMLQEFRAAATTCKIYRSWGRTPAARTS